MFCNLPHASCVSLHTFRVSVHASCVSVHVFCVSHHTFRVSCHALWVSVHTIQVSQHAFHVSSNTSCVSPHKVCVSYPSFPKRTFLRVRASFFLEISSRDWGSLKSRTASNRCTKWSSVVPKGFRNVF